MPSRNSQPIIEKVNSIPMGTMFFESCSVCEKKGKMTNGRVLQTKGDKFFVLNILAINAESGVCL